MIRYKEIMEKVSVTPQMRERILRNVEDARWLNPDETRGRTELKQGTKHAHIVRFMRWMPAVAAACLVLIVGIHVLRLKPPQTIPPVQKQTEEPLDVIGGGPEEYGTLKELENAVGFDVPEVSGLPFDIKETAYTNMFGLARIDYYGSDGEDVTLSKGIDDGTDVSGDSNEYSSIRTETIEDTEVTLKGDGDSVSLALWTSGGYAYALYSSPAAAEPEMNSMLKSVLS